MGAGVRVDVMVSYVAGIAGRPFSGLVAFTPLWRDKEAKRSQFTVPASSIMISASVVPHQGRTVFAIRFANLQPNAPLSRAGCFVGLTNLP